MENIPRRDDFEKTTEWLQAVSTETDADFEVLEAVAIQLRPELLDLPDSGKREKLQRLLKDHTDFMTEAEGGANAWIDIHFERDGEVDCYYQYTMMNHNLTMVKEEEVEAMKAVADEEGIDLDIQPEQNYVMGTQLDWDGMEEELRLIRKVLNEVYDIDIEDIERAEEQREGDLISWTEV